MCCCGLFALCVQRVLSYLLVNEPATTESYTYGHTRSLHDALPFCLPLRSVSPCRPMTTATAQANPRHRRHIARVRGWRTEAARTPSACPSYLCNRPDSRHRYKPGRECTRV